MNLLEQMKKQDEKLTEITRACLELQIACMLLMHDAVQMIKKDHIEDGLLIMATLYAMRTSYNEQRQQCFETLGEDNMLSSYQKIGGDKIIYSSVSDDVIRCNTLYFDLPPRPQGSEYAYNAAISAQKRAAALHMYFPNIKAA